MEDLQHKAQHSSQDHDSTSAEQSKRDGKAHLSPIKQDQAKAVVILENLGTDSEVDFSNLKTALKALEIDVQESETVSLLQNYDKPSTPKSQPIHILPCPTNPSCTMQDMLWPNPSEVFLQAFKLFNIGAKAKIYIIDIRESAEKLGDALAKGKDGDGAINDKESLRILLGDGFLAFG